MYYISLKNEEIKYFLKYKSDIKNRTEALLPKISLFTKIKADRD